MTSSQFDGALKAFCGRRPFRPFLIEFNSGTVMRVTHPEAVGPEGGMFLMRRPDLGYVLFGAENVCRLLDVTPDSAT